VGGWGGGVVSGWEVEGGQQDRGKVKGNKYRVSCTGSRTTYIELVGKLYEVSVHYYYSTCITVLVIRG
jgi:hypothetical protein